MIIAKFLLFLLISIASVNPLQQDEPLKISLKRNWGYSSGTGKIQGTFTIRTSGPDDLMRVVYYLDDQKLGESSTAPFDLRFVTDDFPLGPHQLQAQGVSTRDQEFSSNIIRVEFVSSGQGWQEASRIIIPLLVLIIGAAALTFLVPLIFTRGKKEQLPAGAPRHYGHYGGAICPKCSRPFSRHVYGLNLGLQKYDRCPYCGKWSLVRRASSEDLQAAEAAEITAAREGAFSPQELADLDLRQEIEDSRYEEL
jgi:DNA-directed RNA polymerase subunit RPC12/RpoP